MSEDLKVDVEKAVRDALEAYRSDPGTVTVADLVALKFADPTLWRKARFARVMASLNQDQAKLYRLDDYMAALSRIASDGPASISDRDLQIVHTFDEKQALKYFEQRDESLNPPEPPPVSPAPMSHQVFSGNIPEMKGDPEGRLLKKMMTTHGHELIDVISAGLLSMRLTEGLRSFAEDMNSKNQQRNERIGSLEGRCADLEARLGEIEKRPGPRSGR